MTKPAPSRSAQFGTSERSSAERRYRRIRRTAPESKAQVGVIDKEKTNQVTLDSGARATCRPAELLTEAPTKPKLKGVRFRATNGEDL